VSLGGGQNGHICPYDMINHVVVHEGGGGGKDSTSAPGR
jgi:hypothetical protein